MDFVENLRGDSENFPRRVKKVFTNAQNTLRYNVKWASRIPKKAFSTTTKGSNKKQTTFF